jgi:transcriptional regulator with XRE-family HTH domain
MKLSTALIDRIKQLLKKKGLTYANVAKGLNVSESTLKRWFSQKNFSLKQMEQICNFAGISVEELMKTNLLQQRQEYFSEQQEELFDKNEKAMALFYLTTFGLSFDEIHTNYHFEKAELIKLLNQLEKVNLIELHPNNHIVKKIDLSTMWIPKGKLSTKYFKQIRQEFMNTYFSDHDETQHFHSGRLTSESNKIIQKKIDKLVEEIRELYLLDANEKTAENISVFIGMRPWNFSLISKFKKV